jgi:hypothetical protein
MTFEDWKFAARYGFFELEEYCRTSAASRLVFVVLKDILRRPEGVDAFYNFGVTPRTMSRVVAGMVLQLDQLRSKSPDAIGSELLSDTRTCVGCLVYGTGLIRREGVCNECRDRCFESLRELEGPNLEVRR